MKGQPFEITDFVLKIIEDDSAEGYNEKYIAAGFGITAQTFSKKKAQHPEIAEAIMRGRRRGIDRFLKISWEVAQNARAGQDERDRLARILQVEAQNSDSSALGVGFKFMIIPDAHKPEEFSEDKPVDGTGS